ncbi:serine/threonine-protein kinase Nek2-like [Stigmatopora argus]
MTSPLGGYDVLYTISVGSHGKCQKIRRKSDGRVVVWEEFCYATLTDSETQALMSEVKFLKNLKHPNIVRCYDYIIDSINTKLYIVMEDCMSGNLANLIASSTRGRLYLDEQLIVRIITQLTSALKKFHRMSESRCNFFYPNLKPDNIFLDSEQNVKLGKPSYSPMLHQNDKCSIWSLGCLLYELCTLCRFVPGPQQKVLTQNLATGTFIRLPEQYSSELSIMLHNMLNLTDYLRPSLESLLQSNLLAKAVSEEAKKRQLLHQRRVAQVKMNKKVRLARKNKENLPPGDPQIVALQNIAIKLQTNNQHESQVEKDWNGSCLRL